MTTELGTIETVYSGFHFDVTTDGKGSFWLCRVNCVLDDTDLRRNDLDLDDDAMRALFVRVAENLDDECGGHDGDDIPDPVEVAAKLAEQDGLLPSR